MTSVILSTSPYETVRRLFDNASREEFRNHNIVFPEDSDYIPWLIDAVLAG
jgi:hypothetical protein